MTRINAQRVAQAAVGTLALAAVCAVLFPQWQHRTVLLDREQKLAYWDNDSFAGYQGLPSHVVSQKGTEGTWMDGSRGTEHLPHKYVRIHVPAFACLSIYPSVSLSLSPSFCLCLSLSTYLSACLSVCL